MLVWFFAILCILALCPVPLILESSVAYFFEATQPLSTRSDTTWVQVEPESCNVSRLSLLVGHGSFCCTFGLWKMIYLLCTERFNNSKGFTCNMCCNWLHSYLIYILCSATGSAVVCQPLGSWSYISSCVTKPETSKGALSVGFFVLWVPKDCNNLRNEFTSFRCQSCECAALCIKPKPIKARCQMSGVKSFT